MVSAQPMWCFGHPIQMLLHQQKEKPPEVQESDTSVARSFKKKISHWISDEMYKGEEDEPKATKIPNKCTTQNQGMSHHNTCISKAFITFTQISSFYVVLYL